MYNFKNGYRFLALTLFSLWILNLTDSFKKRNFIWNNLLLKLPLILTIVMDSAFSAVTSENAKHLYSPRFVIFIFSAMRTVFGILLSSSASNVIFAVDSVYVVLPKVNKEMYTLIWMLFKLYVHDSNKFSEV